MADAPTEIILYARERFCPDVTRARTRLADLGIDWTEYDIEADEAARAITVRLTGRRSVPTMVIGDRILVEPSNAVLEAALVAAGHDLNEQD
ncbi:MAG: glutaredoxin family protein [Chloroflexota bacterium]|nr:glutaredoxin family protein [Chloroflexota bacterium]